MAEREINNWGEAPIDEASIKDWQEAHVGQDQSPSASALPEPPPFDIDGQLLKWYRTRPADEEPPAGDFMALMGPAYRNFRDKGFDPPASLNRATASVMTQLDLLGEYAAERYGVPKGELFEKVSDAYESDPKRWAQEASEQGIAFVDQLMSEAMGAAEQFPGMSYTAFPGAAEADGGEKNEIQGVLTAAAKGGLLGALFDTIGPLKTYLNTPIAGTVYGIQPAAESASPDDKAGAAETSPPYAIMTPGRSMGLTEFHNRIAAENAENKAREPGTGASVNIPPLRGNGDNSEEYVRNYYRLTGELPFQENQNADTNKPKGPGLGESLKAIPKTALYAVLSYIASYLKTPERVVSTYERYTGTPYVEGILGWPIRKTVAESEDDVRESYNRTGEFPPPPPLKRGDEMTTIANALGELGDNIQNLAAPETEAGRRQVKVLELLPKLIDEAGKKAGDITMKVTGDPGLATLAKELTIIISGEIIKESVKDATKKLTKTEKSPLPKNSKQATEYIPELLTGMEVGPPPSAGQKSAGSDSNRKEPGSEAPSDEEPKGFSKIWAGEQDPLTGQPRKDGQAEIAARSYLKEVGKDVFGAVKDEKWYRKMPIEESLIVVKSIGDMERAGYSKAQILNMLNQKYQKPAEDSRQKR